MSDTISRQAAIDALEKVADLFPWRVPGKSDTYDRYNEAWNDAIGRAEMEIEKLPSVRPVDKDINVSYKDAISRQVAIDHWRSIIDATDEGDRYNMGFDDGLEFCISDLSTMPSAQPEPRWIPCRYHLPSLRDEIYLVSLAWGGVGTMEFKDTGWHNYGSLSPVPVETVTAWMPLPEAYKEGQE